MALESGTNLTVKNAARSFSCKASFTNSVSWERERFYRGRAIGSNTAARFAARRGRGRPRRDIGQQIYF